MIGGVNLIDLLRIGRFYKDGKVDEEELIKFASGWRVCGSVEDWNKLLLSEKVAFALAYPELAKVLGVGDEEDMKSLRRVVKLSSDFDERLKKGEEDWMLVKGIEEQLNLEANAYPAVYRGHWRELCKRFGSERVKEFRKKAILLKVQKKSNFSVGDRVIHKRFGSGIVRERDRDGVFYVEFEGGELIPVYGFEVEGEKESELRKQKYESILEGGGLSVRQKKSPSESVLNGFEVGLVAIHQRGI